MKKFILGVLIGFVFLGLALVIFFFAALRLASQPPSIPDGAILVYRLEGAIPESPPVGLPLPFLDTTPTATVRDHWEMFRKAAADPRIRAILLMPSGLSVGWGKLDELRADIEAFRKSGKPVYAYLRAPGAREYYVATAADRVIMAPEDFLDLKGLRAEVMYLRKTLDKIGVQIEIEHAGKYKDAGDMFTRSSMSPETREVLNSVLDDLYGLLVTRLGNARKKSPDEMRAIIDQGPFVSTQALATGLVDALEYQDQVYGEIKQRSKLRDIRKVSPREYMRIAPQSVGVETGRRVALIVAEGDIIRGDGDSLFGSEGFITSSGMTRLIERVADDPGIRGVIVRIDSPGGDGFASDEIWRQMTLLSKKKPLVISMSDLAASGGYYMAMTGDPILAYPGTLTGSIGVFYGKADLRGLYDKLGIQKEILSRGRFADIDSDYTPLSDAARKKLQASIEEFYGTFVSRVAQGRHRPFDQVEPYAQGRVWLGMQAKKNGLIDDFGGLDGAIEMVRQKANLPRDEKVRLVPFPPRRTIFEQLMSHPAASLPDTPAFRLLRRFATRTWMEGGMLRMMPYTIEIK